MGETVHRGGTPTAALATTIILAGGTSLAIPANQGRNSLTVFSTATAFLAFAGTAAVNQGLPILPLTYLNEPDFIGTLGLAVPAAASGALVTIVDV